MLDGKYSASNTYVKRASPCYKSTCLMSVGPCWIITALSSCPRSRNCTISERPQPSTSCCHTAHLACLPLVSSKHCCCCCYCCCCLVILQACLGHREALIHGQWACLRKPQQAPLALPRAVQPAHWLAQCLRPPLACHRQGLD
jgi:hypothetical protein